MEPMTVKTLLATTAVFAALITPGYADRVADGTAITLVYAEQCDANDLTPKAIYAAKLWLMDHTDEVMASIARLSPTESNLPKWCSLGKTMLPRAILRQ
jgi:hypothetical protein